jgi:hypothetical protein
VVRAALVQACERIEKINRADDDDLHGLRATARRALRMSDPANWVPKTVQQADGSAVDALEFQLEPEERRRSEEGRARSELDLVQLNIRIRLQKVLLGEAPSTPEFVTEGIDWAKSEEQQTPKEESEDRDFGAKWNERAVVMAAAIAARDYAADDRQAVLGWALPVLDRASREGEDFTGNAQVQYSRAGIATIGLIGHLRKEGSEVARDQLLSLAGNDHEAVVAAVAGHLKELEQVDGRLPRSIVRIVMASAIHTRHRFREGAKEAAEKDRADRIATAIAAERSWLKRSDAEPPWPGLPHWVTRKRKGIRLGPNPETAGRKQEKPRVPDTYADEGRLGSLVQYLIPLGAAGTREWVKRLAVHFMGWTADANGPVDDDPHDRDNRPTTWNLQFFDFLGVISVALPQDEVAEEFLRPMGHFTDEAFCDAAAAFLRGFDRATIATDTPTPENPGKMRALLAERLQKTRSFRRCAREKSFMAETHLGDAFHAMCYRPARWASAGRAHIPTDWPGLVDGMPVIAGLVRAAPSSGYLATLVLNLLEDQARPELLPFVVDCLMAWREAYDADPNFWVEKEIGSRACTWLRTTLERAKASTSYESKVLEDLHLCLDLLVRVGVGHASDVERILQGPPFEKTS